MSFAVITDLLYEQVIYAINAGGEAHTDIHGISYRRDPLLGRGGRGRSGASSGDRGTASAFGRTLLIARSPISDQILYQTERYVCNPFCYARFTAMDTINLICAQSSGNRISCLCRILLIKKIRSFYLEIDSNSNT